MVDEVCGRYSVLKVTGKKRAFECENVVEVDGCAESLLMYKMNKI